MKTIKKLVNPDLPVFMDIESHSLYGEICMVQFYQDGWEEALVVEYPDLDKLRKFVKKHHTVWYGGSYDLGTITYQSGKSLGLKIKIDDLFYAARSAYPQLRRHSLDVVHDYLHMEFYDPALEKKKMQKSFTYADAKKRRQATDDQIAYAKADVYTLHTLWHEDAVQEVISSNRAYALDVKSEVYALEYQRNGIPVDQAALKKERANLVDRIADNAKKLNGLNPRSFHQVCDALGTDKSDKDTLVKLMSEGNELAAVVYDQRRALKADKMLETWDHPRVYTFFNPAGTVTGRFNSSGGDVGGGYVNTQQISRQYQYMFHSTDEDRVTFEVDYSTIELRIGAAIMGEEVMRQELKAGKDLHIEAAKLTGIENPTKEDRQRGKAVSFGLIFSMSAPSFKDYAFVNYGVNFSDSKARRIHRKYHEKYKHISAYHNHCWRNYKTLPMQSAMGRKNICNLGTDASNYATQSSTAEATKWAVHYLIQEHPESLRLIINVIHDAVYMDVPKKDFEVWGKRLQEAMLKGYKTITKQPLLKFDDIPVGVEIEVIGE